MDLPNIVTLLRFSDNAMSARLAMMGGAKSPMTTKNAMQVPTMNPIMLISTASFPGAPKVSKAKTKMLNLEPHMLIRSKN